MLFGRKAKISWQGEKHELTVTMELVEAIDEEVNVLATAIELDKGGIPKITLVSKLYAVLLSATGVSVTKEEVYESIMSSPADSADLVASVRYVLQLCFPQLDGGIKGGDKKKSKG